MKAGVIGFPNVGKKTFFKLLTGIEVYENVSGRDKNSRGIAKLSDERLLNLNRIYKPKKTTKAFVEYILIPDITQEEEKRKQTLSEASEVDLLIHLVRVFADENIYHIQESVEPSRDIENMETELLLSDLFIIEKRLERLNKELQRKREEDKEKELHLLNLFKDNLEKGIPLRELDITKEEHKSIKGFNFLSLKKILVVLNVAESSLNDGPFLAGLKKKYENDYVRLMPVSVKIEEELGELEDNDRKIFMEELGIKESALDRIIREAYNLLFLISFFTVGEDEVKAWTIKKGTPAKAAAGKIHSDMERGFIRAEVMKYDTLLKLGSEGELKAKGEYFLKGKEYIVEDGDIICFRFNV